MTQVIRPQNSQLEILNLRRLKAQQLLDFAIFCEVRFSWISAEIGPFFWSFCGLYFAMVEGHSMRDQIGWDVSLFHGEHALFGLLSLLFESFLP